MLGKTKHTVPVHKIKTKVMHDAGFDIISLDGTVKGRSYDATTFHRHTFFELFFFTSSGGQHEIDFQRLKVNAPSVHFVSPGQIHKLNLKGGNGYVICFTEEFFSLPGQKMLSEQFHFFDNNNSEPVLSLTRELSDTLKQQIRLILKTNQAPKILNYEIIRSYLQVLLLELKQFAILKKQLSPEPEKRNVVTEFKRLVNLQFLKNLSTLEYATTLNISPNYLNSLCRKQTGKTATQLISERILLEAKRLLYSTELSIKEVAFELNFDSTAYFTRFFKKQSGQTPGYYRDQISKNR